MDTWHENMKSPKSNKKDKQEPLKNFVILIGTIVIYVVIVPIPLIIGIKVSQFFHSKLYTGFAAPLFLLGQFLAIQILAKVFKQTKSVPLFSNWRDYIVAYFAVVVFCVIVFYPAQIGYDTLWAYFLSSIIAFPIAILSTYLFGSKDLKQRIKVFFSRKTFRVSRVNSEVQRKARRQLIVLLSALLFVLAPLYPTVIFIAKFTVWFGMGTSLKGIEPLIFLIAFLVVFIIGTIISSIIWYFIMSFYLTVQEWQELNKIPTPYFPLITPVFTKISHAMLAWKIRRESKESRNDP